MDRTLVFLLVVSGLLLATFAPHATFTITAIVTLSILVTRVFWAIVQSFEETGRTRGALD